MNLRKFRQAVLAAPLLLVLLPAISSAQQQGNEGGGRLLQGITFGAGYGHSDNVLRFDTDEIDSDFAVIGIDADYLLERPNFDFSVIANLDYIDYENSLLRDRPDGFLDARIDWRLLDENLTLFVEDNFSQVRGDVDLGDRPDNLLEFNVLTGGVDAEVPLGSRSEILLMASYSDRNARSLAAIDSTAARAGVGFQRRISQTRNIAVVLETSQLEYDTLPDVTEYDVQRAFLRYESQLASGEVGLELGANRIRSDIADFETDSSPMARLTWSRAVAARSTVTIAAAHLITDLGGSAAQRSGDSGRGGISTRLNPTGSPFTETRGSITWDLNYTRTNWRFAVSGSNQQYEDTVTSDFSNVGLNASVNRELRSRWIVAAGVLTTQRNTQDTDQQSRDSTGRLSLRYDIGRRAGIAASFVHNRRSADNGTDYRENQYRIDFVFDAL